MFDGRDRLSPGHTVGAVTVQVAPAGGERQQQDRSPIVEPEVVVVPVADDVDAPRAGLPGRGAPVSEVFHHAGTAPRAPGPASQAGSA